MRHTAVVDLGYGDAGKGTVVDWLCATRPVHAVVRFNGGCQAAHNVITPDGRHHTFAQFGAGTLHAHRDRPVLTYLSRFMLVEPFALAAEAEHLAALGVPDPLELVRVDAEALLTTPYHAAANRARERARGPARHGSCGVGIGETMSWSLTHPELAPRVADIAQPTVLRAKLASLADAVAAEHRDHLDAPLPAVGDVAAVYAAFAQRVTVVDRGYLADLLVSGEVVFEGAQGVLLDEWRGFHPHTTWSTTTFDNVTDLLADAGHAPDAAHRLGVLRAYTTRHGAGPLVSEDPDLDRALAEPHNGTGAWQGDFRVGHFDAVAHRYALEVCGGVDALALTHLDRAAQTAALRTVDAYTVAGQRLDRLVPGPWRDLTYQAQLTELVQQAAPVLRPAAPASCQAAEIGELLGVPVEVTSWGPSWTDKQHAPSPLPAAV